MNSTLYYIHDPMCSWCWGFKPTWNRIRKNLEPEITVEYVIGGLAPDSEVPMPLETQHMIKGAWSRIENMLGTEFNFDFWEKNIPRRSTYPACRAVLAAKKQDLELEMLDAIQQAYYLCALNPSDDDVLIELAGELNMDGDLFEENLNSTAIQNELTQQISLARTLTRHGFPSLVIEREDVRKFIKHDYENWRVSIDQISEFLDA